MRILVTAFGSFPGVPDNPSATALRALDLSRPWANSHAVRKKVLRVSYRSCRRWAQNLEYLDYDLILLTGVARRAESFRLERCARNICGGKRGDAAGEKRGSGRVLRGGPEVLRSKLPVDKIARCLRRRGLPVVVSDSAGDYVCNFLYYQALFAAAKTSTKIAFLHVPAVGGKKIVKVLAAVLGRAAGRC
ncbi:MAG: hypothetical protein ABIJ96_08110 [Elusimicrobiota bacterium]